MLKVVVGYPIMALAMIANLWEGASRVILIANAGAILDAIIRGDYRRMLSLTGLMLL